MPIRVPSHILSLLKNLPSTPGVYQMKDSSGGVIYVGKSVNLKSRVSSYFQDASGLNRAKRQMVDKVDDIEIILCSTEVEALVLETNLIKHLSPKYNILMKDDKNLAYIKITKDVVPEVIKTRNKIPDGAEYFGPYTQGSNIYESIKDLKKLFRIRNCKIKFARKAQTKEIEIVQKSEKALPCMDYYIGICPGPCLLSDSYLENHASHIASLKTFLQGGQKNLIEDLKNKMQLHAKKMEFEEAQKLKILIENIVNLSEKQLARDAIPGNHDIFVMLEKYEKLYVAILKIRDGNMVGIFRHVIEGSVSSREDLISQFLALEYINTDTKVGKVLPMNLTSSVDIPGVALREFFMNHNITVEKPLIGIKKELLDFTMNQLREYAYKSELATLDNKTLTRTHMENILIKLGYPVPKKGEIIFECYDISHTHGQFTYASRVLISNGKPDTTRYKKYKIKTLADGMIDDFASHKEVMNRRIQESITLDNLPHLIIIDGGKGQLSSALSGIYDGISVLDREVDDAIQKRSLDMRERLGDRTFPLCSIAKREEEIFLPRQSDPIIFEKGKPELMVLQKARDESHRFSITANRNARMKSMKKNILEEIPGIGPVTRKNILKLAGSIDAIKNLSEADIASLCTKTQIQTLRDHGII